MSHELKATLIAAALVALLAACQQEEVTGAVGQDAAAPQSEFSAETALAKAEAEHHKTMAQCDTLTAAEQQFCKDQADATLEAARNAAHDESSLPQPQ